MNRELPRAGEVWLHFKNNKYLIITVAQHTETREMFVVYKALYGDYKDFIRPLSMFMSEVDHKNIPMQRRSTDLKNSNHDCILLASGCI